MNNGANIAWIIILVVLFWMAVLIYMILQIARRDDLPVLVKIFWLLVIVVFPVLGLIVYFTLGRKAL